MAGRGVSVDGHDSSGGVEFNEEELHVACDIVERETQTSRAALDLYTTSPKVFYQSSDSPSDRRRIMRELEAVERRSARKLVFDEEPAGGVRTSPSPSSPVIPGGLSLRYSSMSSPQKRKQMMDALNFEGRSDLTRDPVIEPDSEETRRVLHYTMSHEQQWQDAYTMDGRQWHPSCKKVWGFSIFLFVLFFFKSHHYAPPHSPQPPEYKHSSFALVDLAQGSWMVEAGTNAPSLSPCADPAVLDVRPYQLEDVAVYRFWLKEFYLTSHHRFLLCQPEEAELETRPGRSSSLLGLLGKSQDRVPALTDSAASKELERVAANSLLLCVRVGDEKKGDPSHVMAYHRKGLSYVQTVHASEKHLETFLRAAPLTKMIGLDKPTLSIQGLRLHVTSPMDRHVLNWEKSVVQRKFKFGVVYCKNGQRDENEIYSNEGGSDAFLEFLPRLGNVVPLKGHKGFRAGLNVDDNSTGLLSVYNVLTFNEDGELLWDHISNPTNEDKQPETLKFNVEIMYHVSTFLPFMAREAQQLNRKRHIGNDVCVVVFKERCNSNEFEPDPKTGKLKPTEANLPIPLDTFTSQFNHTFIVVTPWLFDDKAKCTHYKVVVCCKDGPPSRPFVPKNGIIPAKKLTHWITMKLLNAERAAMYGKSFVGKLHRTNTRMLAEAIGITKQGVRGSKK